MSDKYSDEEQSPRSETHSESEQNYDSEVEDTNTNSNTQQSPKTKTASFHHTISGLNKVDRSLYTSPLAERILPPIQIKQSSPKKRSFTPTVPRAPTLTLESNPEIKEQLRQDYQERTEKRTRLLEMKRMKEFEKSREMLLTQKQEFEDQINEKKKQQRREWKNRNMESPFLIDLVKESMQIEEHNQKKEETLKKQQRLHERSSSPTKPHPRTITADHIDPSFEARMRRKREMEEQQMAKLQKSQTRLEQAERNRENRLKELQRMKHLENELRMAEHRQRVA